MQDLLAFQAAKPAELATDQQLKCPRCDSTNTKFCYYNNYNLSQPRHFCKNCRRYWTKGGALRKIPVGGGSRKNSKRSSSASNPKRPTPPPSSDPSPAPVLNTEPVSALYPAPVDSDDNMLEITGSFSSLLPSSGHFAANLNFLDGFDSAGSAITVSDAGDPARPGENPNPNPDPHSQQQADNFLGWVGGWPDVAIYTSPGSSFQ